MWIMVFFSSHEKPTPKLAETEPGMSTRLPSMIGLGQLKCEASNILSR
jgi:hypothetical protein